LNLFQKTSKTLRVLDKKILGKGIRRLVIKRLLYAIPVFLVVSLVTFGFMHLAEGDPIIILVGPTATQEMIDQFRAQYGLDQPVHIQYLMWLSRAIQGDLGRSIISNEPVVKMIADRLPTTITLTISSMIFALLIAVPTGVIAAYKKNTIWDYLASTVAVAGQSIPDFFLAILLLVIFGIYLRVLPITGYADFSVFLTNPLLGIRHFILPVIALGAMFSALAARLVKSSMLNVLNQDYITAARAKGLPEKIVLLKHALVNSLIPLITVTTTNFATLLGGAIIIEEIFSLPGIGRLLLRAIQYRDFPTIQGIALFMALVYTLMSIISDILYGMADPRIRVE
jgi:peptide/nickel transport system permease protein